MESRGNVARGLRVYHNLVETFPNLPVAHDDLGANLLR